MDISAEQCPELSTEYQIAYSVSCEEEGGSLSDAIEYAVTVDADPDVLTLTAGEQGPPGPPGPPGTGGGGGLISQKILRFYDAAGVRHYLELDQHLELPIQLADGSMDSVTVIGVLHG